MSNLERSTNTDTQLVFEEASGAAKMAGDLARGAVYAAIESPSNGLIQLANAGIEPLTGSAIRRVDITGVHEELQNGSENAMALQIGAAVGSVLPMYALNKVKLGKSGQTMSAMKTSEYYATHGLGHTVPRALGQGLTTGMIYGTLLVESEDPNNVLAGRAFNGLKFGINFAAFNATSEIGRHGLSRNQLLGTSNTKEFLTKELPLAAGVSGISGGAAGVFSANVDTLMDEGRLATSNEMATRAATEFLFGVGFGALHQAHSHLSKPGQLSATDRDGITWAKETKLNDSNLSAIRDFVEKYEHPALKGHFGTMNKQFRAIPYGPGDWKADNYNSHIHRRAGRSDYLIVSQATGNAGHGFAASLLWEQQSAELAE